MSETSYKASAVFELLVVQLWPDCCRTELQRDSRSHGLSSSLSFVCKMVILFFVFGENLKALGVGKLKKKKRKTLGISPVVFSIGYLGFIFHWVFLSRAQMCAVPNPACAECDLQVNRPPSNSTKLNNVRRSLMLKVSLLGVAQADILYERRKLGNVFSKHTLCILPCNWWPFITYLCVGHSSVVMWSITHVNVSLQNPLNNIWTYSKKYNKRRWYRLMAPFSFFLWK